MKKQAVITAVIGFAVASALLFINSREPEKREAVSSASSVKNATYTIEGQAVTLQNGLAGTATITRYFGNEAVGDLNGDGAADTALLVTKDGGGSGTFFYVVAAIKGEAGYSGTNAILLGDRIAPQTTEIANGVITVNYADREPGEPMAARPSLGVSRRFQVRGTMLFEQLQPGEDWQ